jgi:small subunit ribosomal protein S4
MKRQKKKYETPKRPWDKARLEIERELMKTYGLRRKKELWRAESLLRKYRRIARRLIAFPDKKMEEELLRKLCNFGILLENSSLDDVLDLTVEKFLERRLQTIVFKRGFANNIKQARQFVTHGKIFINKRKVIYPSYLVPVIEEKGIEFME